MKRILLVLMTVVLLTVSSTVNTAMAENTPYININDYGNEVIAMHKKLSDLGYYYLRPESPWSKISAEAVKILQENLGEAVTGEVGSKEDYDRYVNAGDVVGKNLLADADFIIQKDSQSTEVMTKSVGLKPEIDLQNLINRTVTLSIYLDSPGDRGTSVEDANNYMRDRFGCHLTIVWSDSTGKLEDKSVYPCTELLSQTVDDSRISASYKIDAFEGYDCIKDIRVSVQAGARPVDGMWSLGFPKLEIGKQATEYIE